MSVPTAWAVTPDGAVRVRATTAGLPVAVELTAQALRGGEAAVAGAVLALARTAGHRAAAQHRRTLHAAGIGAAVLDGLGLPVDEPDGDDDDDGEQGSWLRPA